MATNDTTIQPVTFQELRDLPLDAPPGAPSLKTLDPQRLVGADWEKDIQPALDYYSANDPARKQALEKKFGEIQSDATLLLTSPVETREPGLLLRTLGHPATADTISGASWSYTGHQINKHLLSTAPAATAGAEGVAGAAAGATTKSASKIFTKAAGPAGLALAAAVDSADIYDSSIAGKKLEAEGKLKEAGGKYREATSTAYGATLGMVGGAAGFTAGVGTAVAIGMTAGSVVPVVGTIVGGVVGVGCYFLGKWLGKKAYDDNPERYRSFSRATTHVPGMKQVSGTVHWGAEKVGTAIEYYTTDKPAAPSAKPLSRAEARTQMLESIKAKKQASLTPAFQQTTQTFTMPAAQPFVQQPQTNIVPNLTMTFQAQAIPAGPAAQAEPPQQLDRPFRLLSAPGPGAQGR